MTAIPKSQTNEFLDDLTNGKEAVDFEQLAVGSASEVGLQSIPDNASTAIVVLEADEDEEGFARVARFTQVQSKPPTDTFGHPLGDNGIYEIKSKQNLQDFRIIGISGGQNHVLQIEYFIESPC